jgi:hypothetical protein
MAAVVDHRQPRPGDGIGEELLLAEREEAVVAPGQDERRIADEGLQRPAVVVAVVRLDVAEQRLPPRPSLHVEQGRDKGDVAEPVGVEDERQVLHQEGLGGGGEDAADHLRAR